jgi:hypothetical protein
MKMKPQTISQKQARDLATMLFSDIRSYIDANRAEYEAFLREYEATKKPPKTVRKENVI